MNMDRFSEYRDQGYDVADIERKERIEAVKAESSDYCRNVLIAVWWATMPDWAQEAYRCDQTVQQVIRECALRETSQEEMLWQLCAVLYGQRNELKSKSNIYTS